MKSPRRLALFASLIPVVAFAGDTSHIDIYRELVRSRTENLGAEQSFGLNTNQFLRQLVDDPNALYAELSEQPRITNEVWWNRFVDGLPMDRDRSTDAALDALRWHSGLSKARPGIDVVVDEKAILAYGGREVAASALKAGVDPDIFNKAADMNIRRMTVAAGYAVALQILRDQMNAYDPADYGPRAIKPDVLDRYMKQTYPSWVTEYDERYLADLLRYEMNRNGRASDAGSRHQLPAAYRVARVAAAYSDRRGYASPRPLCVGNEPSIFLPTTNTSLRDDPRLCFVAATDRAVQSWYRNEVRAEAAALRRRGHGESSSALRFIGTVLALVDVVSFIEVVEEVIAGDLVTMGGIEEADAEIASSRSNRLVCRINQ